MVVNDDACLLKQCGVLEFIAGSRLLQGCVYAHAIKL
ncbi:hypothetical protein PS676_03119 [Pseudomonas fluorescens]|jgi:hypothetical protein|nr:hypothetical protein PS676_03119 [Pseudomonas fluorescens]